MEATPGTFSLSVADAKTLRELFNSYTKVGKLKNNLRRVT